MAKKQPSIRGSLSRIRRKYFGSDLEKANVALNDMSAVGADMEEDLPQVDGWLEGLTSTLSELAGLKNEPDSLVDLIEKIARRREFAPLVEAKESVVRLYECASCVAYGVVTLNKKELREAGECFQVVWEAVESTLELFTTELKSQ